MNFEEATTALLKHVLKYLVMNAGGQMVIPIKNLVSDGTHVRIYIDNENEALILTIVLDIPEDSDVTKRI